VRDRAGVDPTIRLHDLRHWQATQLLDAGVPLPTVAARLGHASGATTMKIYAHRTAHADAQAAGIVSEALDVGDQRKLGFGITENTSVILGLPGPMPVAHGLGRP